jgi:hypothetical protein
VMRRHPITEGLQIVRAVAQEYFTHGHRRIRA